MLSHIYAKNIKIVLWFFMILSLVLFSSCTKEKTEISEKNSENSKETIPFDYNYKNEWKIKITEELVNSIYHHRGSIAIKHNGYIYFTDIDSESTISSSGSIFRMNTEGSEIEKVYDNPGRFFKSYKENLYFIDVSENSLLKSFNTDIGDIVTFNDYHVSDYLFIDDSMYFINKLENFSRELIKLPLNEMIKPLTIYSSDDLTNICSDGKDIYFSIMGGEFTLNKMIIYDSLVEEVFKGYFLPYGVSGNYVIMENAGPHLLDLSGGTIESINSFTNVSEMMQFNFYKDFLVFNNGDGQVFLDNGISSILISEDLNVRTFTIVDNWLVMATKNPNVTGSKLVTIIKNLDTNVIINIEEDL